MKSYVGNLAALFACLNHLGHAGLTITLFLIGTGISMRTVKQSGPRLMLQGVILSGIVAGCSLWAIRNGWISLAI